MISSKHITLIGILLVAAAILFIIIAGMTDSSTFSGNATGNIVYSDVHSVSFSEEDYYSTIFHTAASALKLNGTNIIAGSRNVSVEGSTATILGGGTYIISGVLNDGSIVVDSKDDAVVRLIFNGASINSSDYSALHIVQAEKTVISLVEGTENYLSDGSLYRVSSADASPSAVIHSEDDLTINGNGTLVIKGNYNDGIKADDGLRVTSGVIKISAVDDGINGNDFIAFGNASVEVTSGGDAIKCEHSDSTYGFIVFDGTGVNITSGGDGVYASSAVYVNGGDYKVTTGGGSSNVQLSGGGFGGGRGGFGGTAQNADTPSTKAFKAGVNLVINEGVFNLDSYDDALHSDSDISISGGVFTISTGNDAVHADKNLLLSPERMDISKCLEGIEGGYITINGGDISVVSSDDGINATGMGNTGFGMPMMGSEDFSEDKIYLRINGGNIYMETGGDGVDSNGSAVIFGGSIQVYGPENGGNSSLDFHNGLRVDGGTILAAGNSGMAELPSDKSAQNCVVFYLDKSYASGSEISFTDSDGKEIVCGISSKKFNWVCVSSNKLETGKTYNLKVDGETVVSDMEINSRITSSGSKGGRMR